VSTDGRERYGDLHERLAGSFGATTDVHQEGPSGSFRAFADDPKGHARLVEETYKVGLAKGEPARAGEAVEHKSKGKLLSFVRDRRGARRVP
jgi:hypothetical protein